MTENYERIVGRIEGKLDHLMEGQNQMARKWEELSANFISLLRRQDAQKHQLALLKQRLDGVARPVDEFGRWRERAIGALMLLSLGGALIGGGLVAFWQKMVTLLR